MLALGSDDPNVTFVMPMRFNSSAATAAFLPTRFGIATEVGEGDGDGDGGGLDAVVGEFWVVLVVVAFSTVGLGVVGVLLPIAPRTAAPLQHNTSAPAMAARMMNRARFGLGCGACHGGWDGCMGDIVFPAH